MAEKVDDQSSTPVLQEDSNALVPAPEWIKSYLPEFDELLPAAVAAELDERFKEMRIKWPQRKPTESEVTQARDAQRERLQAELARCENPGPAILPLPPELDTAEGHFYSRVIDREIKRDLRRELRELDNPPLVPEPHPATTAMLESLDLDVASADSLLYKVMNNFRHNFCRYIRATNRLTVVDDYEEEVLDYKDSCNEQVPPIKDAIGYIRFDKTTRTRKQLVDDLMLVLDENGIQKVEYEDLFKVSPKDDAPRINRRLFPVLLTMMKKGYRLWTLIR